MLSFYENYVARLKRGLGVLNHFLVDERLEEKLIKTIFKIKGGKINERNRKKT
jgi:hypothetical protein